MTKTTLVLFAILIIILNVKGAKAVEKSEETEDRVEYIKSEEDDNVSASLQYVHMDIIKDKEDTIVKHDNLNNEDHYSEELTNKQQANTNSTHTSTKYEKLFEDSSNPDEIIFNTDGNVKELMTPRENGDNNAEIEVIVEHITKTHNQNVNNQEDVLVISEEDNSNWRSAENSHSGVREDSVEEVNDEISPEDADKDYSLEDYKDKLGLNIMDRVEPRNPERREHRAKRPYYVRKYGPPDDHSVMESGPLRSFSEILVPRLHPTLTRNGFMYSPSFFALQQTGSPFLDRMSGHNWLQNRFQVNPEREFYNKPRSQRVASLPQYEDSKMIDDYNDYGGANAYSYAPSLKATTPAPPQQIVAPAPPRQIVAPNKFDIFKKLAEASNHPKSAQRTINDNNMLPGNYYPQRQFAESYGPFDMRRFRRNAWDDEPLQDI